MGKKFGTLKGVFIPSTEAILGTVLFLLMPVLVADTGLLVMFPLVLLAHSVTIATAFSLADCATNINRIEGGGLYALSKLSLGKAMGGSIGIMLYFAQTASIGFYAVGFSAPLLEILKPHLQFIPLFALGDPSSLLMQQQWVATFFLCIFFAIVMAGADFTLKIQSFIMVILLVSIGAIFLSPLSRNMTYGGSSVFTENWNFSGNRSVTLAVFFTSFTQFFPAVTGISTGIGMSGDLKDPRKSIVRGTFTSILFTMIIYLLITLIYGRMDRSILLTGYNEGIAQGVILTELLGLNNPFPHNLFGLMVLLGVLFATGSSALSVFMTGPRTAQYLAKDNILPKGLSFMEKDFKTTGQEPRYAILVSFAFSMIIIWMGDINVAAIAVGILFLVVYGWVNGAAFLERISKNPSFRPTFKNHWIVSFYGFIACIFAICLFNWKIGLVIFLSQFILFQLILKYKTHGELEGVWWGVLYSIIGVSLKRLRSIAQGSRNWRPVVTSIALDSEDKGWIPIDELTNHIASFSGLVNRFLIVDSKNAHPETVKLENFHRVEVSGNPTETIQVIVQTSQQSGITANTLLLEYQQKIDTARILKTALNLNKNILLYKRGIAGLDSGLDIWWRGERNGNLMALLSYIINQNRIRSHLKPLDIRIIRKISADDNEESARQELNILFTKARISGEIMILPHDETPFLEQMKGISFNASLVMMGLPGNYVDRAENPLFKINEFFFSKEINKYDDMPPMLFVRSNSSIDLTED